MWHQHKFPCTRHEMNQIIYERGFWFLFFYAPRNLGTFCRAGLISVTLLRSFYYVGNISVRTTNTRKWQFLVCWLYYAVFQLPGRMLLRNMHSTQPSWWYNIYVYPCRAGELMSAALFFFFRDTHTHIRKESNCANVYQVVYFKFCTTLGYVM